MCDRDKLARVGRRYRNCAAFCALPLGDPNLDAMYCMIAHRDRRRARARSPRNSTDTVTRSTIISLAGFLRLTGRMQFRHVLRSQARSLIIERKHGWDGWIILELLCAQKRGLGSLGNCWEGESIFHIPPYSTSIPKTRPRRRRRGRNALMVCFP